MDSSKPPVTNNEQDNTETPQGENPPRQKPYMFKKGSVFVVRGSIYKVTAARPNGKITAKFMGVDRKRQVE